MAETLIAWDDFDGPWSYDRLYATSGARWNTSTGRLGCTGAGAGTLNGLPIANGSYLGGTPSLAAETPDHGIEAKGLGVAVGIYIRGLGGNIVTNSYLLTGSTSGIRLFRGTGSQLTSGMYVQVGSSFGAYTPGDTLKMTAKGTTLTIYRNGTQLNTQTINASTNTEVGVYASTAESVPGSEMFQNLKVYRYDLGAAPLQGDAAGQSSVSAALSIQGADLAGVAAGQSAAAAPMKVARPLDGAAAGSAGASTLTVCAQLVNFQRVGGSGGVLDLSPHAFWPCDQLNTPNTVVTEVVAARNMTGVTSYAYISAVSSGPSAESGYGLWVTSTNGESSGATYTGAIDILNDNGFSVSVWVYRGNDGFNTAQQIGANKASEGRPIFGSFADIGTCYAGTGGQLLAGVPNFYPLSTWVHFCFTQDASGVSVLYRNGVAVSTGTLARPTADAAKWGVWSGSMYVAHHALWLRCLTDAEVRSIYARSVPSGVPSGIALGVPLATRGIGDLELFDEGHNSSPGRTMSLVVGDPNMTARPTKLHSTYDGRPNG